MLIKFITILLFVSFFLGCSKETPPAAPGNHNNPLINNDTLVVNVITGFEKTYIGGVRVDSSQLSNEGTAYGDSIALDTAIFQNDSTLLIKHTFDGTFDGSDTLWLKYSVDHGIDSMHLSFLGAYLLGSFSPDTANKMYALNNIYGNSASFTLTYSKTIIRHSGTMCFWGFHPKDADSLAQIYNSPSDTIRAWRYFFKYN